MNAPPKHTEAEIWERIIHPDGPISKDTARHILQLELSAEDHQRLHDLAERNRRGELTSDEEADLDYFCRVGSLLSALKLRCRRVLGTGIGQVNGLEFVNKATPADIEKMASGLRSIIGKWPGEENDEQVERALRELD